MSSSPFIACATRASARERLVIARDRKLLQRVLAADERDRAPGGAEALVEQRLHEAHLLHEHFLARVRREADEVELAHARAPGLRSPRARAR